MTRLARGKPVSESLLSARLRIRRFWDIEMGQSSVKFFPGLQKKTFDFGVSQDSTRARSGRHCSMTNEERSWLFNIRVGTMVYHRHLFVDIHLYVPLRFAMQLDFSQGVVGVPSSKVKRFGGFLEDQDVIRSGAAHEIPSEVLEQLAEEAEVAAWIQEERAKASMESTGKSRPSGEDSIERPDFDGGAEDDDMMMPEVPADEAVTDPIVASEEEPRDSKVDPESPPADLPKDSDDFEQSMDATFDDASNELMEVESIPPVVEEEMSLHVDIPSPAAPIGKSFLTTLPTVPDMGSRPMEHGESSSEPSRQFAKKDILTDSEEVGLDITDAKAFVDEVITLGNKWNETKSFPNDDFFNKMFFKPSSGVRSELNEISRTRKQLVRERNVTELAIIELTQDQHRLDGEVTEARQRFELLDEQAAAKWAATLKARDREMTLIRQVEEAKSNLRRETQEYEQWQILWKELPRAEDGS
ncbi:hypothetical protein AAC387_Pa03g1703 [Persea americana]